MATTQNIPQKFRKISARLSKLRGLQEKHLLNLNLCYRYRLIFGLLSLGSAAVVLADESLKIFGLAFLFFLILFGFFWQKTRRTKAFLRQINWLTAYLERMNLRGHGLCTQLSPLPQPSLALNSDEESLCRDLQLTGPSSLMSLLDECFTPSARSKLLKTLISPPKDLSETQARQNRIQHLIQYPQSLEGFLRRAQGQNDEARVSEPDLVDLKTFIKEPLIEKNARPWMIGHLILFPIYLFLFLGALTQQIPISPAVPLILYGLFSLSSLSIVGGAFKRSEQLSSSLSLITPLWSWMQLRSRVFSGLAPRTIEQRPVDQVQKLNFYLSALSIEAHWLIHLVVNIFLPWSFCFGLLTEKWRKQNKDKLNTWLDELDFVQVEICFALLGTYHTQTWPQFTNSSEPIRTKEIFHPLIDRSKVVSNSFELKPTQKLVLLTGSNMAGKSTFLRTIGINQILAICGAPVFAEEFQTHWAPVVTCLQISDSLADGYSSFYYEVRRVRHLIERARQGDSVFYFVDEIFRGTNNKERRAGSEAVIKELIKYPSLQGWISTHDLDLSSLAEGQEQIVNGHFRDEVTTDGSLNFTYRLFDGPCQTTNALKIMANEGLPIPTTHT